LLIRQTLMDEGVFVALTTFVIGMCIMDEILWMTHHGLLIMDDTLWMTHHGLFIIDEIC